jgi:hypothetical protein
MRREGFDPSDVEAEAEALPEAPEVVEFWWKRKQK